MMLKPEQLRNMRDCANDGMPFNAHTILMLLDHIDAQQARIDALMLEFCPEEMTEEQKKRWESHQKPAIHSSAMQK